MLGIFQTKSIHTYVCDYFAIWRFRLRIKMAKERPQTCSSEIQTLLYVNTFTCIPTAQNNSAQNMFCSGRSTKEIILETYLKMLAYLYIFPWPLQAADCGAAIVPKHSARERSEGRSPSDNCRTWAKHRTLLLLAMRGAERATEEDHFTGIDGVFNFRKFSKKQIQKYVRASCFAKL